MVLESNCTISPLDLERCASVVNAACGPADGRRPASRVLDRSATLLLVLEVFKFLTGEGVALMGGVYSRLSASERNRIDERRNRDGLGVREIARRINRSPSTIGREPKRGLWFASDENESHRPCRPRRLRAGAWTSLPFHSALTARRRADLRKRESRKPPAHGMRPAACAGETAGAECDIYRDVPPMAHIDRTWDNGTESALHALVDESLGMPAYHAGPLLLMPPGRQRERERRDTPLPAQENHFRGAHRRRIAGHRPGDQ